MYHGSCIHKFNMLQKGGLVLSHFVVFCVQELAFLLLSGACFVTFLVHLCDQGCDRGVTGVGQGCDRGVTGCDRGVTGV
jgi:hypothetical protein